MPKSPNCTGAPIYGAPAYLSFTYPTIRQTTGLSDFLPTSEPSSAQITYTIGASDIPTISGGNVSYWVSPVIYILGYNNSVGTPSISYRLEVNGTSVATGAGGNVVAGYYWGITACNWFNSGALPVVGDVLTVKLWAEDTYQELKSHALKITPTRPMKGYAGALLWKGWHSTGCLTQEASAPKPTWMTGTPTTWTSLYISPTQTTGPNTSVQTSNSTPAVPEVMRPNTTYGLFSTQYGDNFGVGAVYFRTSSSVSGMQYFTETRVATIAYLPLNIKL